jgi:hypothetical protein
MKCKNGTIWKLYVVQRQGTNVESLREKAKLTLNFKKTNQNCRPIEFTKYIKSVRSLQLEEHLKYKNYKYVSQFMLQITIQSKWTLLRLGQKAKNIELSLYPLIGRFQYFLINYFQCFTFNKFWILFTSTLNTEFIVKFIFNFYFFEFLIS